MTQQQQAAELTKRAISICETRIQLRLRKVLALRSIASALGTLLEAEADQAEFERECAQLDLEQQRANLKFLESSIVVPGAGGAGAGRKV